jgi:hypothetical protein
MVSKDFTKSFEFEMQKLQDLEVIIFSSVRFLLKKKPNRTKTGSNRPVSVWFDFFGQKPVQTSLTRFFPVWLYFFGLARFFWFGFGSFFVVSGL